MSEKKLIEIHAGTLRPTEYHLETPSVMTKEKLYSKLLIPVYANYEQLDMAQIFITNPSVTKTTLKSNNSVHYTALCSIGFTHGIFQLHATYKTFQTFRSHTIFSMYSEFHYFEIHNQNSQNRSYS